MTGPRFAGIDVGSTTTKAVIINGDRTIIGSHALRSGTDLVGAANTCLDKALEDARTDELAYTVATGYGRSSVPQADRTVTEITCHGRGAYQRFPEAITVVDIGGQDTKVIILDGDGNRIAFKMNRKCSAGTGVFLEEISHRLNVEISELDSVARVSNKSAPLNSYCTVFASTEMLSRIRDGEALEDLVLGAYESVVRRVIEMVDLKGTVVLTGGVVAYHPIIAKIMGQTGAEVKVPDEPMLMGALGAALIAEETYNSTNDEEGGET
jgi:predicted CoA-substrate-specific enzyme activase